MKVLVISLIASTHFACSVAFVPAASPQASSKVTFTKTRFVPGASPNVILNGPPLFAKKKKKDTTLGKSGKIQVKLLKHVAGTGSAGDVIMVAPAFFTNKLQKTGCAIRITDEEVAKESAEKKQRDDEAKATANDLKEKVEKITLNIPKKAGPDGKLFGGIGLKAVLGDLKKEFPAGCLDAKYIKITSVKDEDGKALKHDIKAVGDYVATLTLMKGVSADFKLSVTSE